MAKVVLLTGTVNPKGMSMTLLNDITIRKQQYIDAINYWISFSEVSVVFVENSNSDFSKEIQNLIDAGKIEFLCFDGNNYDKRLGKGFGELLCIEYAIVQSNFIRDCDFIFKVTGRYKVLNFRKFQKFIISNPMIDILIDFKLNLTFSDSRFFGFKKTFITKYLLFYKNIVNDSNNIYFENILTKAALVAIANDFKFSPMPELPRIEGFSGSLGKEFKSTYLHWIKHKIKYFLKFKAFGLGHMPDF